MPLHLRQPVADFTFQRPDGSEARLSDFRGRPLLVVFLRHLA
jgi:peroxiredoxin